MDLSKGFIDQPYSYITPPLIDLSNLNSVTSSIGIDSDRDVFLASTLINDPDLHQTLHTQKSKIFVYLALGDRGHIIDR